MNDIVKRLRARNFSVFDGIERRMSDLLSGEAADEIERLRALLVEVRDDINDYGFSDSFADETHKTLAKIDIGLSQAYQ